VKHSTTTRGLIFGVLASFAFGTSGAFIKPLLEGGWSPAAAVTVRAGIAGLVLVPIAVVALRGRWAALWRARWRVLGMGLIGVAGTQLAYFAAISRIPVSTALLIEYLAPLILVAIVWVRTRRTPRAVVLIGSVLAIGGLVLTIGPGSIVATDGLGLVFALIAMLGVVGYYLIAARPSDGLPPVAFASSGLVLGSLTLAVVGAVGILPFNANFGMVPMGVAEVPWFVPLSFVALVGTAFAYVASIAASEMLGSRLMSFVGLLEVVFASVFAWLLIGETITPLQGVGGVLILGGIALVRMEREADVPLEPGSVDAEAGEVSIRGDAATRPAAGASAATRPTDAGAPKR
jgi:drug/metabolite transporter (DMT)-like permease